MSRFTIEAKKNSIFNPIINQTKRESVWKKSIIKKQILKNQIFKLFLTYLIIGIRHFENPWRRMFCFLKGNQRPLKWMLQKIATEINFDINEPFNWFFFYIFFFLFHINSSIFVFLSLNGTSSKRFVRTKLVSEKRSKSFTRVNRRDDTFNYKKNSLEHTVLLFMFLFEQVLCIKWAKRIILIFFVKLFSHT